MIYTGGGRGDEGTHISGLELAGNQDNFKGILRKRNQNVYLYLKFSKGPLPYTKYVGGGGELEKKKGQETDVDLHSFSHTRVG